MVYIIADVLHNCMFSILAHDTTVSSTAVLDELGAAHYYFIIIMLFLFIAL